MRPAVVLALATGLAAAACRGDRPRLSASGGDVERGRLVIAERHCGACHDIPGVTGAHGRLAVSLHGFAEHAFVAGQLPNTDENLVRWIRDPQSVEPGTAMPTLGLGERDARDVAAYLEELR